MRTAEQLFSAFAFVLTGFDERLLFSISNDFLFVNFAANYSQLALAIYPQLKHVTFGYKSIPGSDIIYTAHDARRVTRIQIHIGANFVVRPLIVAEDCIRIPVSRSPRNWPHRGNLLQAFSFFIRAFHNLESAINIGGVVRQVSPG